MALHPAGDRLDPSATVMKSIRWAWDQRHHDAARIVASRLRSTGTHNQRRVAGNLHDRLNKYPVRVSHAQLRLLHEGLRGDGDEGELREILDEAHRLADTDMRVMDRIKASERQLSFINARREALRPQQGFQEA